MKTALTFSSLSGGGTGEWTFAHSLWLLGEMNRPLEKGGLGPNPSPPTPEPVSGISGMVVEGSVSAPWTMQTIGQWMGASGQEISSGADVGAFYNVGGILLERNPSKKTGYANYITAVKAEDPASGMRLSDRGRPLLFQDVADRSKQTIYEIKCDRLKSQGRDQELARVARSVMKRERTTLTQDMWELPNTLGAMFISEVARLPMMMPLGLMLLDLIEAGIHYGRTEHKQYTWEKMMKYVDPTVSAEERLSLSKLIGGKHPMMHENTIAQAKQIYFVGEKSKKPYEQMDYMVNPVSLRSVSILVAWLHMYFRSSSCNWMVGEQEADDRWETLVHRVGRGEESQKLVGGVGAVRALPGVPSKKGNPSVMPLAGFYQQAVLPAIKRRSETLDCLLTP